MRIDVARLPAEARAKFDRLGDVVQDRIGALRAIGDRINDAVQAERAARDELKRVTTGANPSGVRGSDRQIEEAESALVAAKKRLAEIEPQRQARTEANELAAAVFQNLEIWLSRTPVASFAAFTGSVAIGKRGEDPVKALERTRERIAETKARLETVRTAPLPAAEAKAIAREQIEKLAEVGRPDVSSLISHGEPIAWPRRTLEIVTAGAGGARGVDAVAVLAWAATDTLIAAIDDAIDLAADDGRAIGTKDRQAKAAELEASLLAEERTEEALIEQLEARGLAVERRPDADPRAVLGLADEARPTEE